MDKSQQNISKEQQETFERFLMGQMQEIEQIEFQEYLKDNPDEEVKFEDFKKLFYTIEEAGLKAKLDTFHKQLENNGQQKIIAKKPVFNRNRYLMAASFAMLITLSGVLFFNRLSPNEKLYNEFFTPDPGLPTVMGENGDYSFYEAMVDYKQGNYDTAIAKWQGLHKLQASNDTLNYFLGTAFLSNGKAASAIPFLNNTLQYNQSVFHEDALYYLALAYLKEGKTDQAINILVSSKDERSKTLFQELTN